MSQEFTLRQIGTVRHGGKPVIVIDEKYRPALTQLQDFPHVIVFGWAHECATEEMRNLLTTNPPYAEGVLAGVFACRAPYRPNPILMTVCPVVRIDHEKGEIHVTDIDMIDGTPVLDVKAYFPVCDRVNNCGYPEWLPGWPEWMPDSGIGLQ